MGQGGTNFVCDREPSPASLVHKSFPHLSEKKERLGCISFAGRGLGQMAGRRGGNEKVG